MNRLFKTQCLLRNRYNIHINIKHSPHSQRFGYSITGAYEYANGGVISSMVFSKFNSYEEALTDAITEALKLI